MPPQVRVATQPVRGEDGHVVELSDPLWVFAAVVDGHGGRNAMLLCCQRLPSLVLSALSPPDATMDSALLGALEQVAVECRLSPGTSGCCVTALLLNRVSGAYACANVGDVHAAHVSATSYWMLTQSHRLQDNADEHMRLHAHVSFATDAAGAAIGPPRLYPGGLACSRALGDVDCPHVSARPHVCRGVLRAGELLLLASDGVWDSRAYGKIIARARATASAEAVVRMSSGVDDATALVVTDAPERFRRGLAGLFSRSGSDSSIDEDATSVSVAV